jgi:hypothetical protein
MTNKTQSNIKAFTVEELQGMNLAKLSELHNSLADKKDKKARLQRDLIAGVIKSKTAEKKAEQEQQLELVPAENSAKPKAGKKKAKGAIGKKVPAKIAEPEAKEEAKPEPEKKKLPKKLSKKNTVKKPDLKKAPKEVQEYIASLESEAIKFPEVLEGEKFDFVRTEFEDLRDLQQALLSNVYSVYIFIDEKIDDTLTQFLVTYANENLILGVDKTRNTDTVVQIHPEELEEGKYSYKEGKTTFTFDYSFYTKEKK